MVQDRPSAVPQSASENVSAAQLKRMTFRKLQNSLSVAKTNITAAGKRAKENFDKSVRLIPEIQPGEEVFIDRPPRPLNKTQTETEQEKITKKLLPRSEGPFKVISVSDATITVSRDGLPQVVSIDRVVKVPNEGGVNTPGTDDQGQHTNQDTPSASQPETEQTTEEYPVDRIVGHRETPHGTEYLVRWFNYGAEDDSYVAEGDIPYRFIQSYRRHASKRRTGRALPQEGGAPNNTRNHPEETVEAAEPNTERTVRRSPRLRKRN